MIATFIGGLSTAGLAVRSENVHHAPRVQAKTQVIPQTRVRTVTIASKVGSVGADSGSTATAVAGALASAANERSAASPTTSPSVVADDADENDGEAQGPDEEGGGEGD
jgi:hypothetical protein